MGSKRGNKALILVVCWLITAVLIGTAANKLIFHGPVGDTLRKKETGRMLVELAVLFLWNLWWLCLAVKAKEKKVLAVAGLIPGWLLFLWGHRILVPLIGAAVWMGILIGYGACINSCFWRSFGKKDTDLLPVWEKIVLGLTTGSAAWMVFVCVVSLTGHGGIGLWRKCGMLLFVGIMGICLWKSRAIFQKSVDNHYKIEKILPETVLQAALLAFILTMLFLQAGRLNRELDYDSLHYGLRSVYVLDNGKGIYENLGMINLVYTYSKGAEVLVLPLAGTPTYGFVLSFTFWTTVISVITAAVIGRRFGTKTAGFWTGALFTAIPGIMNMAVSAKSDNITLMCQLIIYDMLCLAAAPDLKGEDGCKMEWKGTDQKSSTVPGKGTWLIFAVSVYILSLVYKPTALVFSTALGGVGLVCLLIFTKTGKKDENQARKLDKRGFLTWILPLFATAGLWYRTWLLTGVPVTSVFANFFEKIGFKVKYPYNFSHVIGDPSVLSRQEKISRLLARLKGILISPVGEDMDHVIIAWGTVLVTALLLFWIFQVIIRVIKRQKISQLDFFDGFLMITLLAGSAASIYTLSQVDGNYFILVYAVVVISTVRITGHWFKIEEEEDTVPAAARMGEGDFMSRKKELSGGCFLRIGICLLAVPFLLFNTLITSSTSWAGCPGFTPFKLVNRGYYDHRHHRHESWERKGCKELCSRLTKRNRVVAFGFHPQVLDMPCSVQSYYDITGSGGDVYLVKKLAYFEEYLKWAKTEYIYVQAGYLADQPRACQIIEDMIAEGTLKDITFEWGNMLAKVDLDHPFKEPDERLVQLFRDTYSMEKNGE